MEKIEDRDTTKELPRQACIHTSFLFFFKTKGSSDDSDNSDVKYAYGTFSQRKVFGVNRATFPTEFLVVSILKMQFDLTSFWILSTAILIFFIMCMLNVVFWREHCILSIEKCIYFVTVQKVNQ